MSSGSILFPYSSIKEPRCLTTQVSATFQPKVCSVIEQRSRGGSLAQLGRAQTPLQTRLAYIFLNLKSALFFPAAIPLKFSKAEREIHPFKHRSETSLFLETPLRHREQSCRGDSNSSSRHGNPERTPGAHRTQLSWHTMQK